MIWGFTFSVSVMLDWVALHKGPLSLGVPLRSPGPDFSGSFVSPVNILRA